MRRSLVALILLTFACSADGRAKGPAEFVGSTVLEYDLGFFGGISGLELGPDGREATLLLDTGLLIRGELHHDDAGQPTGIRQWRLVPIQRPVYVDFGDRGIDTEGLAVTDDAIFVSLERIHAIWRLGLEGEVEERLPRHPDFGALQPNASFEALAIDGEGALYALPESSASPDQPFPLWRYRNGHWTRAYELPRRGRYLAVGADFGPDGLFYLLERRMLIPFGFAARIRRFHLGEDGIESEETLLETPIGTHDNLEGLAVWRDRDEAIRLTMVSDDNYWFFQETQIVEYRLPPKLDASAAAR